MFSVQWHLRNVVKFQTHSQLHFYHRLVTLQFWTRLTVWITSSKQPEW